MRYAWEAFLRPYFSHAMKHSSVVILDNSLRTCWYGQGMFGLSNALHVSAKRKRDSSGQGKGKAVHIQFKLEFVK